MSGAFPYQSPSMNGLCSPKDVSKQIVPRIQKECESNEDAMLGQQSTNDDASRCPVVANDLSEAEQSDDPLMGSGESEMSSSSYQTADESECGGVGAIGSEDNDGFATARQYNPMFEPQGVAPRAVAFSPRPQDTSMTGIAEVNEDDEDDEQLILTVFHRLLQEGIEPVPSMDLPDWMTSRLIDLWETHRFGLTNSDSRDASSPAATPSSPRTGGNAGSSDHSSTRTPNQPDVEAETTPPISAGEGIVSPPVDDTCFPSSDAVDSWLLGAMDQGNRSPDAVNQDDQSLDIGDPGDQTREEVDQGDQTREEVDQDDESQPSFSDKHGDASLESPNVSTPRHNSAAVYRCVSPANSLLDRLCSESGIEKASREEAGDSVEPALVAVTSTSVPPSDFPVTETPEASDVIEYSVTVQPFVTNIFDASIEATFVEATPQNPAHTVHGECGPSANVALHLAGLPERDQSMSQSQEAQTPVSRHDSPAEWSSDCSGLDCTSLETPEIVLLSPKLRHPQISRPLLLNSPNTTCHTVSQAASSTQDASLDLSTIIVAQSTIIDSQPSTQVVNADKEQSGIPTMVRNEQGAQTSPFQFKSFDELLTSYCDETSPKETKVADLLVRLQAVDDTDFMLLPAARLLRQLITTSEQRIRTELRRQYDEKAEECAGLQQMLKCEQDRLGASESELLGVRAELQTCHDHNRELYCRLQETDRMNDAVLEQHRQELRDAKTKWASCMNQVDILQLSIAEKESNIKSKDESIIRLNTAHEEACKSLQSELTSARELHANERHSLHMQALRSAQMEKDEEINSLKRKLERIERDRRDLKHGHETERNDLMKSTKYWQDKCRQLQHAMEF